MSRHPLRQPPMRWGPMWLRPSLVLSALWVTALSWDLPKIPVAAQPTQDRVALRHVMVDEQIRARGVRNPQVLAAMETVPRHLFVPRRTRDLAYEDRPLPIGQGQTISQPYIVALMSSLLDLEPDEKVLEIGTGSAYHAAVLSRLADEVYTIEIVEPLARRAELLLQRLGYENVFVKVGDGYRGWPEAGPFDAILLTAAPPEIPQPLLDQLALDGILVAPVGESYQRLQVITRTAEGWKTEIGAPVRFVPMTGEAQMQASGVPKPRLGKDADLPD